MKSLCALSPLCGTLLRIFARIGSAAAVLAAPPVTNREVLSLTPAQAAASLPIELKATLLVNDPFRSTFFIHDGTTSCYAAIHSWLF